MEDHAMADRDIKQVVKDKYGQAALRVAAGESSCCTSSSCGSSNSVHEGDFITANLYTESETAALPAEAVAASLGCGNPTALAELKMGETVLDLGSGGGIDVLLSARRVGPTGKAYGLDMTDEMLELARRNAADAGVANAEFLKGYLEELPLEDGSVDVVISNCVINLAADKRLVLREAARVLRPGGRFAVSDVIADEDMDVATRADMQQWTGCIAGALTRAEFKQALADAGLVDIEVRETHRVHEHAGSAIIRARKPIS
jgi:arsenite methyltransferase